MTSNLVNVFGNWILIYGNWGAPAMGVRGSALATGIARFYLAAVLLIAVRLRDPGAFHGARPDLSRIVRLLKLGFPAALTIGFEVGVFNTVTAIAGKLDPISLAAHAIALNAASVTYMVPLGIASAAAVSVGKQLGAKNRTHAARAGWTALGVAALFELGAAALFVFLPRQIARTYTHDQQVISLSLKLLRVAAVFQLFDGLQVVATGALRGAGDTRTAMVWNLAGYWAVGLPLGCWLCFVIGWGVTGLWWGLCLALVVIGAALAKVWHNEANRICAKVT
jgi:MATE family multidrug resistance protein